MGEKKQKSNIAQLDVKLSTGLIAFCDIQLVEDEEDGDLYFDIEYKADRELTKKEEQELQQKLTEITERAVKELEKMLHEMEKDE